MSGAPSDNVVAKMLGRGCITIAQAAENFDIPQSTIRDWIKADRIKAVRLRHSLFVDVRSIREAIEPVNVGNGSNKKARSSTP